MAQVPTPERIKEIQELTKQAIEDKIKNQQEQGKDFIVNDDGHHAGVIPEDVWKGMKS